MSLHALYERLCTAPLNWLPCCGALEVTVALLWSTPIELQIDRHAFAVFSQHQDQICITPNTTDYGATKYTIHTHKRCILSLPD